jgi:hypothetical protein
MIDYQYAMGFFDGEGTIIKHRGSIEIHVTQCQLGVLEEYKNRWGGTICVQRDGPISDTVTAGVRRKVWRWKLVGYNAYTWLKNAEPHLIVKKKKAREIITLWENRTKLRNRMPNEYYVERKRDGHCVKIGTMTASELEEEMKFRSEWLKVKGWD